MINTNALRPQTRRPKLNLSGLKAGAQRAGLSYYVGMTLVVSVIWSCLAGSVATRTVVNGYLTGTPGDTPFRFIYFLCVAFLAVTLLLRKLRFTRASLASVVALLLVHFVCSRFEDLDQSETWVTTGLTLVILISRVSIPSAAIVTAAWITAVANLGSAILRPSWAFFVDPSQKSLFTFRLSGVEPHPNELGFTAAVFILMIFALPKFRGRIALLVALSTCLLLADSRTSILALIIGIGFFRYNWKLPRLASLVIATGGLVYSYGVITLGLSDFFSLSGRTNFWPLLLAGVSSSPIIGLGEQGVELISSSTVIHGFNPGNHAHNTGLQILVEGGALGLFLYLYFILAALRIAKLNRLGLAMFALILVRSFSEATVPWSPAWFWIFAMFYFDLPQKAQTAVPNRARRFRPFRRRIVLRRT